MAGINKWYMKPDREEDAHPRETYDAERDCYYYDPEKKRNDFIPHISISCSFTPSPTEKYAEVIKDIVRNDYPNLEIAEGDMPIAIRMSVYPVHDYAGGLQPYVIGESIVEWEKWLFEALKGIVWRSEKQVCVTGTEIRHRDYCGIKIDIYFIREQLTKKSNRR